MSSFLWLEPVGGCSGDMTLAALLDLGVPLETITSGLDRLGLPGWTLSTTRAHKQGIYGTRVDVRIAEGVQDEERTWFQIRDMILAAGLPKRAEELAVGIFERIAVAEAHIHGTTPDHVHFHEVGAIDSIVDVVGSAIGFAALGVDRIFSAPPPLGSGIVQSQHGPIPVPAPATVEILKGREVLPIGTGERTTPTGAAILAAVTEPGPPPRFVPEKVAYGIGHRDFDDAANVLRATLCRAVERSTDLVELACNLDDTTPEVLAGALAAVLEAGALDAWLTPVTMKKGRPGHILGVLAPFGLKERIVELLMRETPTLGVRFHRVEREELTRHFEKVQTRWGEVSIKVGTKGDEILNGAPEWDECVAVARAHGVAPRVVREEALALWITGRRS